MRTLRPSTSLCVLPLYSLGVQYPLANLREFRVSLLFFFECFAKKRSGLGKAQMLCESCERSVSSNLVVLHHIPVHNQRSITQWRLLNVPDRVFYRAGHLVEDFVRFRFRFFSERREYFLQPCHMSLSFT